MSRARSAGDFGGLTPSEFDPVARVYRPAWAISHAHVHRAGPAARNASESNLDGAEHHPFAEDGTRLIRPRTAHSVTSGDSTGASSIVSDGLTLDRLYARFDAIATGWVIGDSSMAHRSIVDRLASNESHAAALGWSNFLVARCGGTGRLELHGSCTPGGKRELVPDQIPWR